MRGLLTRSAVIGVLLFVACSSFAQEKVPAKQAAVAKKPAKTAAQIAEEARRKRALELIEQSHALLPEMSINQQLDVLGRLAAAAAVVREPELAKQWSHELFDLGPQMKGREVRRVQFRAIASISSIDPDDAFLLIEKLDPAALTLTPREIVWGNEVRQLTSTAMFEYARKKGSKAAMPKIWETAQAMGEQGYFPYLAVARAAGATKDAEVQADAARLLLTRFEQRVDGPGSAFEFIDALMFTRTWWPKESYKTAVNDAVDALLAFPVDDTNSKFEVLAHTTKQEVAVQGPAEIGLLRFMPVLKLVDPKRAEQVIAQFPRLGNPGIPDIGSGNQWISLELKPSAQVQQMEGYQRFREMDRYRDMAMNQNESEKALQAVRAIRDPSFRVEVASAIAQELMGIDQREKAEPFTRIAQEAAAKDEDGLSKFRSMCATLQETAGRKESLAVLEQMESVYRLADTLMRKAVEEKVGTFQILSSLDSTVEDTVKIQPGATIAHIESVYLPYERARLLVAAALGLAVQTE